jgi:hypothetical protein
VFKIFYYLADSAPIKKHFSYLNGSNLTSQIKWSRFPYGHKRKREILIDKLSGQKYEKYVGEFDEIRNEKLIENDDIFDDEINYEENVPKLSDYPMKTDEELMDNSGTRW